MGEGDESQEEKYHLIFTLKKKTSKSHSEVFCGLFPCHFTRALWLFGWRFRGRRFLCREDFLRDDGSNRLGFRCCRRHGWNRSNRRLRNKSPTIQPGKIFPDGDVIIEDQREDTDHYRKGIERQNADDLEGGKRGGGLADLRRIAQ